MNFIKTLKNLKKGHLILRYSYMVDFYGLLNSFINKHKAINTETKDRKDKIMNDVKTLYDNYFDVSQKLTTIKR